jgi:6-phosphogluconolactonase (cycloisomerase 2 family)
VVIYATVYATLTAKKAVLNVASSSCASPAIFPRTTAPMKSGRFYRGQSHGQMNKSQLRSHLHAVGMTGLHTFVLGVSLGRQAFLELGFHVRGARVTVVPGEKVALGSDIDRESVR